MNESSESKRFFEVCENKLDHIIQEINALKTNMTDNYKKLDFQFKALAISIGACMGVTLHQLIASWLQ